MAGEAQGEILPGNERIWSLLPLLSGQWLVGPGGAYGLNYLPVFWGAREMGIGIDRRFIEKLRAFESAALEALRGNNKGCTPEKKEKCRAEFGDVHLEWICKNCEEMNERHG